MTTSFTHTGSIPSQGLLGSVVDTNWDSSVPQAASSERQGEGTCTALIGFHLGAQLDYILATPLPFCL